MIKLKVQFGKQIYFYYIPILGVIQIYRSSAKKGNPQQWVIDIITKHPEVKLIVSNSVTKPVFIIVDPEYYKPLYLDHHLLVKHDQSGIKDFLLSKGLLFAEGEKWKEQRSLLGDHFLFEKLKDRIPMMNQVTRDAINNNQTVDKVFQYICSITGGIVIRSFFGQEAEGWLINDKPAQIELGEILKSFVLVRFSNFFIYFKQKLLGMKSWDYCLKAEKEILSRVIKFKQDLNQIISNRKSKIEKEGRKWENGDFLDVYLNKLSNSKDTQESYQYQTEDIISQFITLFLAGTETTGALVSNSLLFLSENTSYLEDLRNEAKSALVDGQVTADTLKKLVQLECFLKEVMRLKPSVVHPIVRQAKSDIQIKDFFIKKDSYILLGSFLANINSNHYEKPLEFNPKRWLQPKPIQIDNGFVNIPFAAGGRNCIGQHMAMIEARIILAHVILNYDIIKNPELTKVDWLSRGIQTYLPDDAIQLKKLEQYLHI
ncbi:unnamed protein product [Paramecium octaurelia]|uniref:Cytochrome P450 n=1 Tax=Paramecium octaurelia TaxID=43137 RepID=A0A8S1XC58_PAROT|nr:unnamed protein product [Paramecium octaurelia]